ISTRTSSPRTLVLSGRLRLGRTVMTWPFSNLTRRAPRGSRPVTTPSNEILSSRKETMSPLGRHRKAGCGFLTAASVQFDLEVELLPLIKRRKLGRFYRGSVHEDILASVVGRDKAVTLDRIIPFYCAGSHFQTSIYRWRQR